MRPWQKGATSGTGQTASSRHGSGGCRLVCDGNTAAVPPIAGVAAAPEFGGISRAQP